MTFLFIKPSNIMHRSTFALSTMGAIIIMVTFIICLTSCASTEYTSSTYRNYNHGTCAAYQTPQP